MTVNTRPGDLLTETLFLPNPDGSGHPGAPDVPADIVGQWSATTADLHSATLLLHQETAFDMTALGRWLAAGQQGSV